MLTDKFGGENIGFGAHRITYTEECRSGMHLEAEKQVDGTKLCCPQEGKTRDEFLPQSFFQRLVCTM